MYVIFSNFSSLHGETAKEGVIRDLAVIFNKKLTFEAHIDRVISNGYSILDWVKQRAIEFSDPYITKTISTVHLCNQYLNTRILSELHTSVYWKCSKTIFIICSETTRFSGIYSATFPSFIVEYDIVEYDNSGE